MADEGRVAWLSLHLFSALASSRCPRVVALRSLLPSTLSSSFRLAAPSSLARLSPYSSPPPLSRPPQRGGRAFKRRCRGDQLRGRRRRYLSVCLSRNQRAPMHYCAVTYEGEGHSYDEVIMPEIWKYWSPLKGKDRNHGAEQNERVFASCL